MTTLTEAQVEAHRCRTHGGYHFHADAVEALIAETTQQARADAVAATTKLDDLRHRIEGDETAFIGSVALITALYETYVEHIGITEIDGPDGPYIWCACGWRSDDLSPNTPGLGYAVHLTNAQHAAAVKALQPIIRRILPSEATP